MQHEATEDVVQVPIEGGELEGKLVIPPDARSLVLFAHGSGSSRFSPRNNHVADMLNQAGLATLLIDMLTAEEDEIDKRTREYRFNIEMLGQRLQTTIDWLNDYDDTANLHIGLFGASTGAAAALIAAANQPDDVSAVVSRGGRADLAGEKLSDVRTPTLLIVGGKDRQVIGMNQEAMEQMPDSTETEIKIVQGASHLFEEPGKLDEVANLAAGWFREHLVI
jgi:dienelactone hydrolase